MLESQKTPTSHFPYGSILIYAAVPFVLFPLVLWAIQTTQNSQQLLNASIILIATAGFLIYNERKRIHLLCQHDKFSLLTLAGGFVLIALQGFTGWSLLALIGIALICASIGRFLFGESAQNITRAIVASIFAFLVLALLLPSMDWPLRYFSGTLSATVLGWLGQNTQLYLVTEGLPHLILESNGHPFVVAAQCNGFGLLSASILLTTLLCTYRRLKLFDIALCFLTSVLLALIMNQLRIAGIILLAPHVSDYDFMHEAVGIFFYYSAVLFTAWLIWSWPQKKKPYLK